MERLWFGREERDALKAQADALAGALELISQGHFPSSWPEDTAKDALAKYREFKGGGECALLDRED